MQVYGSDDYAGLEIKGLKFYYGYEATFCKKHGKDPTCEDDHDCEKAEWCFTVTKGKKEIMRIPASVIEKKAKDHDIPMPIIYVCIGMGIYLESKTK